MSRVSYPYQGNRRVFMLCIVGFSIAGLILGRVAIANKQGLIVNRLFELSVMGATAFYWALTIAAGLFVVVGCAGLAINLILKRSVELDKSAISAPKNGISKQVIQLDYADIQGLDINIIQKQRFLTIYHMDGRLCIPEFMLPDKNSFEDLVERLTQYVTPG